jgi:hypothetical protein
LEMMEGESSLKKIGNWLKCIVSIRSKLEKRKLIQFLLQ